MVKRQTRKMRVNTKKMHAPKMGLKKLREAFDSMEKFVDSLGPKVKHSFSDAVIAYRNEWRRIFKREISPADAAAYLKFRFNLKGKSAMTRRTKMRGGALPIAGAPLDYQMRPGSSAVYGNFPSYQQEGLDRYYGSALSADCGKPNGFPTDGSAASQKGGSFDALFRPLQNAAPPGLGYTTMMEHKGVTPFPTSDPVGFAATRTMPTSYLVNPAMATWYRTPATDIYK
jgi:hypothetical protein